MLFLICIQKFFMKSYILYSFLPNQYQYDYIHNFFIVLDQMLHKSKEILRLIRNMYSKYAIGPIHKL